MKKLLVLAFILPSLLFNSCKKDSSDGDNTIKVVKKNTAFYNKQTATWCNPCGSWGWDLNMEIRDSLAGKAICVSTYGSASSLFFNQTAGYMCYMFAPNAGWPAFCVNGYNKTAYVGTNGVSPDQTKTNCLNAVNDFLASPVIANSGFSWTSANDSIYIKTRTEFFEDGGSYEYYINAYIIEKEVSGIQEGQTGIVIHHDVLRGSGHSTTWGVLIPSTTAGSSFEQNFTTAIDPEWNMEQISIITVIWKKEGTKYRVVNAYTP